VPSRNKDLQLCVDGALFFGPLGLLDQDLYMTNWSLYIPQRYETE